MAPCPTGVEKEAQTPATTQNNKRGGDVVGAVIKISYDGFLLFFFVFSVTLEYNKAPPPHSLSSSSPPYTHTHAANQHARARANKSPLKGIISMK